MGLPAIKLQKELQENSNIYYHVTGGIKNDDFYIKINKENKNIIFFTSKKYEGGIEISLRDEKGEQNFSIFDIDKRTVMQVCGNIKILLDKQEILPNYLSFF